MESSLQLPYSIEERENWNYIFITKHGIQYHAYFIDVSYLHPEFEEVYTFNIEPEDDTPHPIDVRIALTVADILRRFFLIKERAMLMVCDNLDGKEQKRELLFSRWFSQYNEGYISKYDASSETEDYRLYVSIYLHKENPRSNILVTAFYQLVSNGMYPVDEE